MDGSYIGKPCPKCAHVRGESENAPDWQCPKCGVAYAKFLQSQVPSGAAAQGAAAVESSTAPAGGSRRAAMFAHLSILLGFIIPLVNIIVPVVVWKTKQGEDETAVACAKEAINFQISMLLGWVVVLVFALLGFLASFMAVIAGLLMVVVLLASIIMPIVATVKASDGESYRYPYIWHIFE